MMGYGYENAAGDRISALIDMINGGGPGRSGGTFEGGGILSLLANAVAKPYGSVRERPGHTPMGAAAPAQMEVLRPEPVDAAVLPGSDTAVPVDMLRSVVEGAIDRAEAAPRLLTEDEAARLANLPESIAPPDLLSLFNSIPPGSELSPEESVILDALLASASFNLRSSGPRGLKLQRTAAPVVSPLPKPRPAAVPAAGPAGTEEAIRVPYLGTVFNVFPKTGRVVVEYPVANAEKGYFAAAGDELRPGTQYYYDVMELVKRGR